MKFLYVTNQEEMLEGIDVLRASDSLACDTETYALQKYGTKGSALDPHTGRISLLICKGRDTLPVVFDIITLQHYGVDLEALYKLLQAKDYLLFHNAKFDLKFFLSTFGWMPENVHDTLILAKLLGNATGSKASTFLGCGYADLCRDFLNIEVTGKKDQRESTWYIGVKERTLDNEWWLEKLTYAANDVMHLFPLEDLLYDAVTGPIPTAEMVEAEAPPQWGLGMQRVLDREYKYIPLLAEREYEGLPVSKEMMELIQRQAQEELMQLACDLSVAFDLDKPLADWEGKLGPHPNALKTLRSSHGLKHCIQKALRCEVIDNVQASVLERLVEIIDALSITQDEESEGGSDIFIDADEEALYHELTEIEESVLLEVSPILKKVLNFKKLSKQASMNLTKFINPATKRIHANISQIGTATGRVACQRPNLQQVTNRINLNITIPLDKLFLADG